MPLYLKISPTKSESISYPPSTPFELKNKNGFLVLKNNDQPKSFSIDEEYTLTVYPTYKKGIDTFQLSSGMLELVNKESNYANGLSKNNYTYESNGLSMSSEITKSTLKESDFNAKVVFSNGIIFHYEDGKFYAKQNKENLDIKGKYLIYFEGGVIKLSFNQKSGEIWWVFEPKTNKLD